MTEAQLRAIHFMEQAVDVAGSQSALSRKISMGQGSVSRALKIGRVSPRMAVRIHQALGFDLDEALAVALAR